MSSLPRHTLVVVLAIVALVLGGLGVASACNVPVFRYALEHWRADRYRLVVVQRGSLDEEAQALASSLEVEQELRSAAFSFRSVDLNELAEADQEQFTALAGDLELPALVVQYPEKVGIELPFWKVPFNRDQFTALTQSPARQELVRRLAQGQTAVWLLLESGDQAQDDAAAELLARELKRLEKELKLPELTEAPEDNLATTLPLKIAFSVQRVARGREEAALVEMLLASEPDLKERQEPLVFPVFGRGRALLPMIGKGITAANTQDYAEFLVGACSCEVKEQNPGFDLLLTAEWDDELAKQGVRSDATDKPAPAGPAQLVPIPPGAPKKVTTTEAHALREDTAQAESHQPPWSVVGAAVLLVLVSAVWIAIQRK